MPASAIEGTQIRSGTVTDSQVAAANKDGAVGTVCMRSLGNGAQQAMAGNQAPGGDLSGTLLSAPTVAKIQGNAVSSSAPASGEALAWSGTAWTPGAAIDCGTWTSGGGGSTPSVRASSSATATGISVVVSTPTNVNGDTLLAFAVTNYGGSSTDVTPPSGWTAVSGFPHYVTSNQKVYAWTKTAASEGASYTFTIGSSATCVSVVSLVGAATLDAVGGFNDATSTSQSATGVTTAGTNRLVFALWTLLDTSTRTFTPPGGVTQVGSTAVSSSDVGFKYASLALGTFSAASAGATSSQTGTWSGSGSPNGTDVQLAFYSASGGGVSNITQPVKQPRGPLSAIPSLAAGQLGVCTDGTNVGRTYVGTAFGNVYVGGAPVTSDLPLAGVNAQSGTSYTVAAGDLAKLLTLSNSSAVSVSLPQAGSSFPAGWWLEVQNRGAGTVTVTPTTSTIDASSSILLRTNQGVVITSDGTNYSTQRGVSSNSPVNNQTGTSYAVVDGDLGKLITVSNSAAVALTIPSPGVFFTNGWWVEVQNRGGNVVTITPSAANIDGALSLMLAPGQGVVVTSDGSNYYTQRGMQSGAYSPVNGMNLTYLGTTSLQVEAGNCPDSSNTLLMSLASASPISLSSTGAGGVDTKAMTGTVSTTNASTTVTGSSSAFLTDFGTRAATGTISFSASTTALGTGTKFLSQVAVNDLIGNATGGYYRVTAIASDTSLTLSAAATFTSASFNVIEQPTIQVASQTVRRVDGIASATSLTTTVGASATASAQSAVAGAMFPGDAVNNFFYHAFVNYGGSATAVVLSTQRTKPYLGYAFYRRLGAVVLNSSGTIIQFLQTGGQRRETHLMPGPVSFLNGGTQTSFTTINCRSYVPPTSNFIHLRMQTYNASAAASCYLRPSNLPGTAPTTTPYCSMNANAGSYGDGKFYMFTDWSQQIDYQCASGSTLYLTNMGFVENI